jgi:predicted Rossmann fold nucleotide-binding protein DprA/Smf involved in DNA uptake
MAVPGSVRNPAAAGTNGLLADGCAPVLDVDDVLVALGLTSIAGGGFGGAEVVVPSRLRAVFDAVDDGPTSVDEVTARSGRPVLDVVTSLAELVASGHVVADGVRVRRA